LRSSTTKVITSIIAMSFSQIPVILYLSCTSILLAVRLTIESCSLVTPNTKVTVSGLSATLKNLKFYLPVITVHMLTQFRPPEKYFLRL